MSEPRSDALPGCAVVTRLLGGNPAGTAARMTSWLLIEQPGPWQADALERVLAQAFPPGRLDALRAGGLRPLLVRRPGRHHRSPGAKRAVFVASGRPGWRWLERIEVSDLAELAALDLEAVGAGVPGHGVPVEGPMFLVCTHGSKDMCCAVLGRPLAGVLAQNHPDRAWEVSHLGGDRWAGNLLVVPDGFLHGQLGPDEAALVAKAALTGQVAPEHLRGRTSATTPWAQFAEIALRKAMGYRGVDSALAVDERPVAGSDGHARVVTVLGVEREYEVVVRRNGVVGSGVSRCSGRIEPPSFVTEGIRPLEPVALPG
ncbi:MULTISPECIES: sucrase ferredoxin [Actinosynnema]|uniref:Sucrase ferredoxin n=1 Tax=Actinosynnema pretiosum TaxID=42197 RepID=A0A290ZBI3_9PSEU|nr:sucrase ferredoxin [Actinosynnema pretiosum]ATE56339.1 sucrase ferredoxin [Actinosynnema pretiosum]